VSPSQIPVACVQTRAYDREDFEQRFDDVLAQIARAGEGGARLIVLPEGTVPAYVIGERPVEEAIVARAQSAVAALAIRYRATIVYGSARTIDGLTYNTATTIGPDGALLGAPAKHFLWHFDRRWFAPGTALEPVRTPVGLLGILVCADGRLPTIARTLVARGAEMLVMPTAWVTSGRDPSDLENVQADLFVNVRAHENGVPFVVANKAGVERHSVAYCGKSAILSADGAFLARAPQDGDAVLFAELSLAGESARATSDDRAASALDLRAEDGPPAAPRSMRARIAIATSEDPAELADLAGAARIADATHLIAPVAPARVPNGLTCIVASDDTATGAGDLALRVFTYPRLRDPGALVPARLAQIDLFVCTGYDDDEMGRRYLRTRAVELRAYVVGIDCGHGRAIAIDPDGAIVAGTFGAYRVAAFVYDRARSGATAVAPHTDVLDGLRAVEPHYRAALLARDPELAHGADERGASTASA